MIGRWNRRWTLLQFKLNRRGFEKEFSTQTRRFEPENGSKMGKVAFVFHGVRKPEFTFTTSPFLFGGNWRKNMFSTVFPIKGSWSQFLVGARISKTDAAYISGRLSRKKMSSARRSFVLIRRGIANGRFLNTFRQLDGGTFNFLLDRGKLDTGRPNSQEKPSKPAVSPRD